MKKLLCVFLLFSSSLFAQSVHSQLSRLVLILLGIDPSNNSTISFQLESYLADPFLFLYYPPPHSAGRSAAVVHGRVANSQTAFNSPVFTGSADTSFAAVYPAMAPAYNYFPDGDAAYNALIRPRPAASVHADLTTVQQVAPPDPQLIFLDGFGAGLVDFDLTTLSAVSVVPVPSVVGPFGIRSGATEAANEVWVLNSGFQLSTGFNGVSIVNPGTQSLVANITIPSIPAGVPIGIVFTNDGTTAFEAIKFNSPDSAGNNGALVVFDAVGRTVTSTMLLKITPNALLMAPDASTAYILGSAGTVTYYDVLSGTADLTVQTYAPGSNAGYPGLGSAVAIHPDGTRLFWNVGVYLTVFDLTTRQVTSQFNSGLPTTVGRTFSLSPDGATAYFSDKQGDVAVVDTSDGTVLDSFNTGSATSVFVGPPLAP